MHRTAWTKKSSSLPSDRIKSSNAQNAPSNSSKAKGKGKEQKSPEVRKLEALADAIRNSSGNERDAKGGCYCQGACNVARDCLPLLQITHLVSVARVHALSPYNPICRSCGLVLCDMNEPHHACPSCSSSLLSPNDRLSLVVKLEAQILDTLAREANDRERAAEEVRKAAGAFPALAPGGQVVQGPSSGSSPNAFTPRPVNETHKVLSLNPKTKKVTVSTYSTTTASSRPLPRTETVVEEPKRVPRPSPDVVYVKHKPDPARVWADFRGGVATYIPVPRVDEVDGASTGRSSRRPKNKKGKGKENEDGEGAGDVGESA